MSENPAQTADESEAPAPEGPSVEELAAQYVLPVTIVHGGDEPVRAAVLDEAGVVTAVVLVPADWETQDPDTRYRPDGEVVVLEQDEAPPVGGHWDHERGWVLPQQEDAPPAQVTPSGESTLRRDVDLLLQLVLTSQDGEANDVASLAPTLRGMAERASLTTAAVDGAFGWGVITSDERAELLEVAQPPREQDDDLDSDEPEEDEQT